MVLPVHSGFGTERLSDPRTLLKQTSDGTTYFAELFRVEESKEFVFCKRLFVMTSQSVFTVWSQHVQIKCTSQRIQCTLQVSAVHVSL